MPASDHRPLLASALPPGRKGVGWDALVAVLLGGALLAGGWVDVSAYLAHSGKATFTFHLAGQGGDARIGPDEFYRDGPTVVRLSNVAELETNGSSTFRHGLGPVDTLQIWTTEKRAQLDFVLENNFDEQEITVTCNGQTLEQLSTPRATIVRSYVLDLHPGVSNELTIRFEHYNGHGAEIGHGETRPIAGTFQTLNLYF